GAFKEVVPSYDHFYYLWKDQSPNKVTMTDIFFLRSIEEGTMTNLGIHFRVITEQILQTLTVEDGVAGRDAKIDPEIPQDPPMDQEDVTKSRGAGVADECEPREAACDVRGDDEKA
ncbi:hypothetical protein Tco_0106330, partial [Tanacetum coccineum]